MDDVIASSIDPTPKNDYHLTSDVKDVLRLEICKSQPAIEEMKSCLSMQQDNLIRIEREEHSTPPFISFVILCVVIGGIAYAWRKINE